MQEATGENIFNLIDERINICGQSLSNGVGFATDGASNVVGCNNSVWSRPGVLKLFWSAAHYFAMRNIVAHP